MPEFCIKNLLSVAGSYIDLEKKKHFPTAEHSPSNIYKFIFLESEAFLYCEFANSDYRKIQ